MTDYKIVRWTVALSLAVLACLNFMFAQQAHQREGLALFSAQFEELSLPKVDVVRAAFLNYSTFAADVTWIALNTNLGAARMEGRRLTRLMENGRVVRDLDPHFRRIYDWFPAVWLASHRPNTFQDVKAATEFMRPGMEAYPLDSSLPFSAAMSHIGIRDSSDAARDLRYRRIIELLEMASVGENVHPDNPFVLAYHRRRLRAFELGESPPPQEEREFYATLYTRSPDPEVKKRLLARLRELGGPTTEIAQLIEADATFSERRDEMMPYVPVDLFTFVTDTHE